MRPVPEAPFAFVMSFLFASLVIHSSVALLVVLVCRLSLSLVCAREEGLRQWRSWCFWSFGAAVCCGDSQWSPLLRIESVFVEAIFSLGFRFALNVRVGLEGQSFDLR